MTNFINNNKVESGNW